MNPELRISTRRLRQLARRLRRDWPIDWPVEIRTFHDPTRESWCGDSDYKLRGVFVIRLNKALPTRVVEDTLMHEWAHLLTWEDHEFHNRVWATRYATLIRWAGCELEWRNAEPETIDH